MGAGKTKERLNLNEVDGGERCGREEGNIQVAAQEWKENIQRVLEKNRKHIQTTEVKKQWNIIIFEVAEREEVRGVRIPPSVRWGCTEGMRERMRGFMNRGTNCELGEDELIKTYIENWIEKQQKEEGSGVWKKTKWHLLKNETGGFAEKYETMIVANLEEAEYGDMLEYLLCEIMSVIKSTRELECLEQLKDRETFLFASLEKKWTLLGMYAEHVLKKYELPDAELFTTLSAERYEGSDSEARIYFGKENLKIVEYFAEGGEKNRKLQKIDANIRMIRKLMEISKRKTVYLVAEKEGSGYVITCLAASGKVEETAIYIKFIGFMHWSLNVGEKEVLTYYHGCYSMNFSEQNSAYLEDITKLENIDQKMVKELVRVIEKQKKGTAVIFADEDAQAEARRLCDMNRGIRVESMICYEQSEEGENGWNEEQLLSVTALDGALFMDYSGKCLAIGVIVDGKATIQGDVARGARYNSIVNYVKQREGYIGIVVSEDGMINIV